MIVPGSPFLMTSRHFSCATVNLSRDTFNWRTLVIKQDWKIMPIVRKSIFDHEKRILIKHSVLLCLLHMRLNITAKINQQSLSLSYSVCMQTSVLFQASSEWTDGTCSLKSHRWQLISVASGVKKKFWIWIPDYQVLRAKLNFLNLPRYLGVSIIALPRSLKKI